MDAFAGEFRGDTRNSGDVAARPRKARDESGAHRISRVRHDDGDVVRGLLCRLSGGREPRDDDVDFETDQLVGQFGKPAELPLRRSKFVSNVLPFDVPEIMQPLPELPPKLFRIGIANDQSADSGNLRRVLCAREERPNKRKHRRAAEQRDELPPPYEWDFPHCVAPRAVGAREEGSRARFSAHSAYLKARGKVFGPT